MKRILITLLLAAAAVAAVVLWRGWPHLFPSSDTDDLYRRYEHNDYIRATHLKDFQVNDTLAADALLLEATTDSAWCELLGDFGVSNELINMYKTDKESLVGEGLSSITKLFRDKNDIRKFAPLTAPESRVVIASHSKKSLCIFMTENENQKEAICLNEVQKLKKQFENEEKH
jgi:hypothetical protein